MREREKKREKGESHLLLRATTAVIKQGGEGGEKFLLPSYSW